MNILLDIIIVLLIIIPIVSAASKGFVKSISKIAALIAALIVAVIATPHVCKIVDAAGYRASLEDKLHLTISGMTDNSEDAANDIEDKDSELYKFLGNLGVDVSALKESLSESTENAIDGIAGKVSVVLAEKLIYFICFAAIFLACYIIAAIVLWLISKFVTLPVLKSCDRALGIVIGVIYALVATVVFIGIFNAILPYISSAYPNVIESDVADKTLIYKYVSSFLSDLKNLFF